MRSELRIAISHLPAPMAEQYLIATLTKHWRKRGLRVQVGEDYSEDADVCVLHHDISVLDPEKVPAAPAGKPVELFVEGPTPQWALPIPKPAKSAPPGRAQFSFELDGLPSGVDPKSPTDLIFTVVTGDRAVEVKTHLD